MKKIILAISVVSILGLLAYKGIELSQFAKGVQADVPKFKQVLTESKLKSGDLIFQTSMSRQSEAIQVATKSKYSHMGIVYKNEGSFYVYEAVQPVKLTPLKEWINRGAGGHYVVKRLKNAETFLTPDKLKKLKAAGEEFEGKDYDLYFEWTNDKIYCSELVWKMYKNGLGVSIGALEQLKDFDLSSALVQEKLKERYGKNIPLGEKVISPDKMFNSAELKTIIEN